MRDFKESSIKIFYSTEYSLFRTIGGNRQLNEAKIKRIERDVINGLDLLRYCPIIVNDNAGRFDIVDGQHRFYIARRLKKPVYFIIANTTIELSGIAKMNSNTDKWKKCDYINCFAHNGNEDYITLQSFIDKWKIPASTALQLLGRGLNLGDRGGRKEAFELGRFKVNCEREAEQILIAAEKFFPFKQRKQRAFLVALAKLLLSGKKINYNCGNRLSPRSNPDDYVKQLAYFSANSEAA